MHIVIVKGFGSGLGFVAQKTLAAAKTSAYYSVATLIIVHTYERH